MFIESGFGGGRGEIAKGYAASTGKYYLISITYSPNIAMLGDISSLDVFPELFGRFLYYCTQHAVRITGVDWDFTPKTRKIAGVSLSDEPIDFSEQRTLCGLVRQELAFPRIIQSSDQYFTDITEEMLRIEED